MKIKLTVVSFISALLVITGCAGDKQRTTGYRVAEANTYESEGEYDKALKELERGLRDDPYSGRLYFSLGNLKLGLGDFEGAKTAFRKAVELYEATGDYKKETDPFNKLRASYDKLGTVLTLLGRYDAALTYHSYAEIQPYDNYLPQRGMALAYLLKGENEKALELYADYVSRFPEQKDSMEPFRNLMEETAAGRVPREAVLEYLKAAYAALAPEVQEEHFGRAAALAPGYAHWDRLEPQAAPKGVRRQTEEEQKEFLYVRSLVANGNLKEARKRLSKLKRMYPDNPMVYQYLGVIHMNKGKFRKAEKAFLKGLEAAPGAPALSFNLAQAYLSREKFDKAEETALGLARENPLYPDVNLLLARIMAAQGKYEEAVVYAEKEAGLDPKNPKVYAGLGELYFQYIKDYARAAEYYGKSLELNPDDFEVRKRRSDAYVQLGEYQKARDEMLILRKAMSKNSQLYGQLAHADAWIEELENEMRNTAAR